VSCYILQVATAIEVPLGSQRHLDPADKDGGSDGGG
jgi:hypothetical protein